MGVKRLVLLVILGSSLCWAQADDSKPAPTNIPGAQYPFIHSDSSVTFRVRTKFAIVRQNKLNEILYDNIVSFQSFMELGKCAFRQVERLRSVVFVFSDCRGISRETCDVMTALA